MTFSDLKKRCKKCGDKKSLDDFYICKRLKSGGVVRRGECKKCHNEGGKKRMRASKELQDKKREYNKRWRQANPNKVAGFKERGKAKRKAYFDNRRRDLTDGYVRGLLASDSPLREKDIPQELVDVKRAQIKIQRLLNERQRDKKHR